MQMQYSETEGVFVELRQIPPALRHELWEFARGKAIKPIDGGIKITEFSDGYCFSGFLYPDAAAEIKKWYEEKILQEKAAQA